MYRNEDTKRNKNVTNYIRVKILEFIASSAIIRKRSINEIVS